MSIGWNHIILEGYCGKNWEYQSKSSKYYYKFDKDKDIKDWIKTPNPNYDPDIKKPERPEYCKNQICYTCYENDCPHLATGKGNIKHVIWANKQKKKRKNVK